MKSDLNKVAESNDGTLYDSNGFLIAVLSGSYHEMGGQYGALMVEHMQKAHDVLIEPGRKSGAITDNDAKKWTDRAVTTCSTRYRQFHNGVVEGSGWPIDKVGMLDQINEFGLSSRSFTLLPAARRSSRGGHSADGGMYIGRNMDWSSGVERAYSLPDAIYRAKGFLYLDGVPSKKILLQMVGRRSSLNAAGAWGGKDVPATRIVMIGACDPFDAAAIFAALHMSLPGTSRPRPRR